MEFECLNVPDAGERLENLRKLYKQGPVPAKLKNRQINNHVHTKYSFSPYSPTYAVYKAYISGLDTVGIVDHDSFCGAEEFVEAGRIVGSIP
ncbi:MAG: PHP domain-containing protein [Christensenellales bacterium]